MNPTQIDHEIRHHKSAIEALDEMKAAEIIVDTSKRFGIDHPEHTDILKTTHPYQTIRHITAWRLYKQGYTLVAIGRLIAAVLDRGKPYDHTTIRKSLRYVRKHYGKADPVSKELTIIVKQTPEFKLEPYGI